MADSLRTHPLPSSSKAPLRSIRAKWLFRGVAAVVVAFVLAAVAANLLLVVVFPWRLRASLTEASPTLSPETPITVTTSGLGGEIRDVRLYEAPGVTTDAAEAWQRVPVELVALSPSTDWRKERTLRIQRTEGTPLLDYDRRYRLEIAVTTRQVAFPIPTPIEHTTVHTFATLATPQLQVPDRPVALGYADPLTLRWSTPVSEFRVEVTPRIAVETRVDPSDSHVGYVKLLAPEPGLRYEVHVVEARGVNGAPLLAPAKVSVQVASAPRPLVDAAKLEDGERIVLSWDKPVERFSYEITPAVENQSEVSSVDRRATSIALRNYQQGQEYTVRITGAVGVDGAPLRTAHEFKITTPPPVEVTDVTPNDGAYGVSRDAVIEIALSEPVRDQAAAEAAIAIEPAIPGRFEWASPSQVRFVPEGNLPPLTDIVVRVAAGPDKVRAEAGGFLGEPFEFTFRTQPNKLIDVDLTNQRLVLYEDGKPVFSTLVATGVRGGETPPGLYMVDYKMPTARFRGVNPSGSRYDIPNVPWVMSFLGDYTIHGSPWRTQFGFPQSAGCVSMSAGDAKIVYDWSPVGTPVRIHY